MFQAVDSFDSCYKLLTALTATTGCCQLWKLLPAGTAALNSYYKRLPDLTAVLKRFDSFYQLLRILTAVTIYHQLWQLLQAVASINFKLGSNNSNFNNFLSQPVSESFTDMGKLWSDLSLIKMVLVIQKSMVIPPSLMVLSYRTQIR